ncbi:MAG TPA: apolipoprotein N-acyltransferase [Thermoanaerobaculia bacterium]|nr:apolipoprotein N-acyltransferase [Thermoanaerobaculia bacterium]
MRLLDQGRARLARSPWTFVLAATGGVWWALLFGQAEHPLQPWFAFAPLLLCLGAARPGWLGFVHGVAFWLTAIPWIVPTVVTYGQMEGWLGGLLFLALAAYLALYSGLFARLGAPLWRRGGAAAWLGLPALWVSLEVLRAVALTGFPWNPIGHAFLAVPGALPLAAWVGVWGVSALVVVANLGTARALWLGRWRELALAAAGCLLVLSLAGRFSLPSSPLSAPGLPMPVRLLQPNIQNLVTWDDQKIAENLRKVFDLSYQACDQAGALVVWPESAGWPFSLTGDGGFRSQVESLAARGCPVLLNSSHEVEPGAWYNSGFLVASGQEPVRADKRHLVPFGEYVPLARLFPFISRIARNAGDFRAAQGISLLPWEDQRIGLAICFEVIFPSEVAQLVEHGASILLTVTNDAWYGDTAAPWQHLAAARFRAAENRRTLVRAAITGVSAVIGPRGEVEQQLGVGEEGIIRASVLGREERSPYSRRPWAVPLIMAVTALFFVLRERKR